MISGQAEFRLASVPAKPPAPTNMPSVTNSWRVGVIYGENLPDNGGSQIINIELWMDDGKGNFSRVLGHDTKKHLSTAGTITS